MALMQRVSVTRLNDDGPGKTRTCICNERTNEGERHKLLSLLCCVTPPAPCSC